MTKGMLRAAGATLFALSLAAPANAGELLEQELSRGKTAMAGFSVDDPIVCADGSEGWRHIGIIILGNEYVLRRNATVEETDAVSVDLYLRDSCADSNAYAHSTLQYAPFRLQGVQQAAMAGWLPFYKYGSGEYLGSVSFDILLAASGAATRYHSAFNQEVGELFIHQHSNGAFRSATASGTVQFNGQEMISSFTSGSIGTSRTGYLKIER